MAKEADRANVFFFPLQSKADMNLEFKFLLSRKYIYLNILNIISSIDQTSALNMVESMGLLVISENHLL